MINKAIFALAGSALLVGITASPSAAAPNNLAINKDGATKATASFEGGGLDQLCVNLRQGYKAVATIAGNAISDFSANGSPECMWVYNTGNAQYDFGLSWYGTGGDYRYTHMAVFG